MEPDWDGAARVAAITGNSAAAGRWPVDDDPSPAFPIYTRANIGEVFPDVVQPLSWTLWGIPHAEPGWRQAFANLGAFDLDEFAPDRMEMLGVFGGYGYLNVSASRIFGARTPGLSPEAIDASFFGAQPDVPPYAPRPGDDSPVHAEKLAAMLAWLFAADELPELDAMRAEVRALRRARPDLATLGDPALFDHVRALCDGHWRRLWVRHIMATYHATIVAGVIGQLAAAAGMADRAADLLTSDRLVDSAEPAHRLWALAEQVGSDPALTALFDAGLGGLADRIAAAPDAAGFAAAFDAFLADYGFRGPNEWEMRSRCWEIDPATPLAAIDRMRHAAPADSPSARAAARLAARDEALADMRAAFADQTDMRAQLDAAIRAAALFFAGRERTKTTCAMLIHEMRMAMWELGRRFAARGLFERPDQFALLTVAEWEKALDAPGFVADLVRDRAAAERRLAALDPPFIVDGRVPPLESWRRRGAANPGTAAADDLLQGQPGCAGVARGRARIVTDPGDPGDMAPGDVLVAPFTDPSWTPLMAAAAAVVVNVGATVSHAVIVARELGVPCVVSLAGATERIPEGALIEVDGARGTVRILEVEALAA